MSDIHMTKLKRGSVAIHHVRLASLSVCVVLAVLFVARTGSLRADAQSYLLVDLGTLGGLNSGAAAINTHDQVVGASQIAGSTSWHAFTWTPTDGMTDLGTLGGSQSSANVVNDHGQVAGDSTIADD